MSQERKRKRQGGDEQEVRLSDKRLKPITLDDDGDRKPPRQSLDPKAAKAIQTSLSPKVSEIAFMDLTTDEDLLPELTHEISFSPDSENTHSLDGFSQYKNTLPIGQLPGHKLD